MQDGIPNRPGHSGPGFREFVGLIASMMAMNAMSIDAMLPALTHIGQTLRVTRENDLQLVVAMYLAGFGVGQLFYGPISDRFGRKPVLLAGITAYVLFATIVSLAWSFPLLLAGRVLQGFAAAATRVLSVSIVRDCFAGRMMARVTSLTFMVFLAVPILAPSLGQFVLATTGDWRWIFGVLTLFGLLVGLWTTIRLPETLHPEYRRAINLKEILGGFRVALTTRQSVGYMCVSAILGSSIFVYIGSVSQIFTDIFKAPKLFPAVFAVAAAGMALGSLINARMVERLGMRMISHWAIIGFIVSALLHLVVALAGFESIMLFAILQASLMFFMALATSNVSALAMEPLGRIAGTAASLQGFVVTLANVLIGLAITQQFAGSVEPIIIGYLLVGVGSLAVVLITERGALFRPHPLIA
jgi:DHA1 family bicyclomycin/chloramphenicol resistance-like MFS transporter